MIIKSATADSAAYKLFSSLVVAHTGEGSFKRILWAERRMIVMGKRIISAAIGIFILLFILISGRFIELALGILILMALAEIYKPFGFFKKLPLCLIGFAGGIAIILAFHFTPTLLLPVVCAMLMVLLILAVCMHKQISFRDIAILLFSTLYVTLPLLHIRLVEQMENGKFLIYAVFIGAFMTDSGAYFTGYFLGKHKLIPDISPKKTVEGAIGGVLSSVLGFVIFGLILVYFFEKQVNWPSLLLISVLVSIISQFGDLAASMIKREMNIKDYGSIFPGHGGVLDRFDSVIFVAPTLYYLMQIMPIIG